MKKIFCILCVFIALQANAQGDDPLDGDGQVPVDGGITLLLAAGAAYGGRRLQLQAKRNKAKGNPE